MNPRNPAKLFPRTRVRARALGWLCATALALAPAAGLAAPPIVLDTPDLSGSPQHARQSIECLSAAEMAALARVEARVAYAARATPGFSEAGRLMTVVDSARGRMMLPIGITMLGLGVSGLATGVTLTAVNGGTYNSIDAGVTLSILAPVAIISGVATIIFGRPRCRSDEVCARRELGVIPGPSRVGVGFKF